MNYKILLPYSSIICGFVLLLSPMSQCGAQSSNSEIKKVVSDTILTQELPDLVENYPKIIKLISSNIKKSGFYEVQGVLRSSVSFTLEKTGKIDKISVEGDNEKFNNEVRRVFTKTVANRKWKPQTEHGSLVARNYRIPIVFITE